jgi:hypothetical protein
MVLVFIFCYSLSFCLNVLEMLFPEMFRSALGFMLNDATNLLVVLNSSSSFIFYTQCSRRLCGGIAKLTVFEELKRLLGIGKNFTQFSIE